MFCLRLFWTKFAKLFNSKFCLQTDGFNWQKLAVVIIKYNFFWPHLLPHFWKIQSDVMTCHFEYYMPWNVRKYDLEHFMRKTSKDLNINVYFNHQFTSKELNFLKKNKTNRLNIFFPLIYNLLVVVNLWMKKVYILPTPAHNLHSFLLKNQETHIFHPLSIYFLLDTISLDREDYGIQRKVKRGKWIWRFMFHLAKLVSI